MLLLTAEKRSGTSSARDAKCAPCALVFQNAARWPFLHAARTLGEDALSSARVGTGDDGTDGDAIPACAAILVCRAAAAESHQWNKQAAYRSAVGHLVRENCLSIGR